MSEEKQLKDQRIPIMMTESELKAIDDWSFKNRIRSRGDAIRRLCQIGLTVAQDASDLLIEAANIFERNNAYSDALAEAARPEEVLIDITQELYPDLMVYVGKGYRIASISISLTEGDSLSTAIEKTRNTQTMLDRELKKLVETADEIKATYAGDKSDGEPAKRRK